MSVVDGFTKKALAHWSQQHLEPGSTVISDGLACFNVVTDTVGKTMLEGIAIAEPTK